MALLREVEFVEWMIKEAKAGRASLPKRSPQPIKSKLPPRCGDKFSWSQLNLLF